MLKKFVQQGRSERKDESYSAPYVEDLNDARTKLADFFSILLARTIHEYRREAFETEARRGFSQVRPTEENAQSVEEAEQEKPRRARGSARRQRLRPTGRTT